MLSARGFSRLQHLSCLPGFESQAPDPAGQDPVFLGQTHRGRTLYLYGGDSHQSVALNFCARPALSPCPLPIQGPLFGPSARGASESPQPTLFPLSTGSAKPPSFPASAECESNTPVSAYSRPFPF